MVLFCIQLKRKEFLERLDLLEMKQKEFALFVAYSYQTIKQWKDNTIPNWVPILLDYLEMLQKNSALAKKYNL